MKWEDDELRAALAELRDEELPASALAAVRARVRERTGRRRAWGGWFALAAATAAAVALLVSIRYDARPGDAAVERVSAPRQVETLKAVPPSGPQSIAAASKPRIRTTVRRDVAGTQPAPSTDFIKLVTDDPDVVILWAADGKGVSE